MARGASMFHVESALLVQRGLTVLLSAHNACFFLDYARRSPRRRLGAAALALFNAALGGESLAFGLLPHALAVQETLTVAGQVAAAALSLAAAVLMAAFAVRHKLRNKR